MITCSFCNTNFTPTAPQNKKFCSKKCSKASFSAAVKKPRRVPTYVLDKQKTDKAKELYNILSNSHLTAQQVEKKHNVTVQMLTYNKCLTVEPIIVPIAYLDGKWNGGKTNFYPPQIEQDIAKYNSRKNDYIGIQYMANKLGVCEMTIWEYKKEFGSYPQHFSGLGFLKNDADAWVEHIKLSLVQREINKKHALQARIAEREKAEILRNEERLERKKAVELRNELQAQQKLEKKAERQAAKAHKLANPTYRVKYYREPDPDSWSRSEEKVKQALLKGFLGKKKISKKALAITKKYHANHESGIINNLTCFSCCESKPYYNFYFTGCGDTGRDKNCRKCFIANSMGRKFKKTKNSSDFITQFNTAIKKYINDKNNKYVITSTKKIWEALPYTRQELIENIESKMESWMNWGNNTRPRPNQKTWHLDHVIAKSSFQCTSLKDGEFLKCWSLGNLKPIEAIVNITKSNLKDMNTSIFSKLKSALKRNSQTKHWDRFFEQSPEVYKNYIESQFSEGMNWSNHGTFWHIDHIIPCAALPWSSIDDDNYKKLWHSSNLRPLKIQQNLSKGSKHDNKKFLTATE